MGAHLSYRLKGGHLLFLFLFVGFRMLILRSHQHTLGLVSVWVANQKAMSMAKYD